MNVWVCQVRREAFVGGESQRCRHSKACENCKDHQTPGCGECQFTGQVSECGVMELIGGEPVEWCVVHGSREAENPGYCQTISLIDDADRSKCEIVSQVRVVGG